MQPDPYIGRNRDVHHLGIRQLQIVHQLGIFIHRLHLEARIEQFLLADGGNGVTLIIVGRIDERGLGQLQELVENRIELRARIAVLKIGATGAADQQSIAGEDPVGEQERIGIVGVAGRVEHVEPQTFDLDPVAFGDPHRDDIGMGLFAHHRDAMGAIAQRP